MGFEKMLWRIEAHLANASPMHMSHVGVPGDRLWAGPPSSGPQPVVEGIQQDHSGPTGPTMPQDCCRWPTRPRSHSKKALRWFSRGPQEVPSATFPRES
eukprot:4232531-Pyramimonas_sp.AAC.1